MVYDTSDSGDSTEENAVEQATAPDQVVIEGDLPLTAIDIESQKDIMGKRAHPIRNFSKWFAARPTPAVRLAVLGSIYPTEKISDDKLLKLMQIGPKEINSDIEKYVEKKYKQNKSSSDTLDEHYGYPNPNTQNPSKQQLDEIKSDVASEWGGELPTILDPTAGRGTIPFEAMRYGLPVISNELDPIPYVINKIALEFAPDVGPIEDEYRIWTEEIIKRTEERISKYFPTKEDGRQILNYAMTYLVTCDSCGGKIPLTGKWWLNKNSDEGHAIKPVYSDGGVSYNYVKIQNTSDFDPSDAPVARGGDAECPHCGVTTDSSRIREKFQDDEFEYSVYGVNYRTENGNWEYRAGDEIDLVGLEKAKERASSFELMDFFAESILDGKNRSEIKNYGMEQWRDVFTPRQLVVHYELFDVFDNIKNNIYNNHNEKEARLLCLVITQAIDRQLGYNTRLSSWRSTKGGYVNEIFTAQNYSIKRMFGSNNIIASRRGLQRQFDHVINNFDELAEQAEQTNTSCELLNLDAKKISNRVGPDTVEAAVVDPPYFDSIMYGEMSDFMYLTQGRLLEDVIPDAMDSQTNNEQMVVNDVRHDNPEKFYESSMKEMFEELRSVLVEDGVLTLMFTDRETKAWNTILKALIQSNFTITAAHPIKTEASDKLGMQDAARVESSIFVTARNTPNSTETSSWDRVKSEIESIAREEAQRLLSVESINKIDTSIEAFGAALEAYSDAYPVEDKYGDTVYPGQVLTIVRNEVYSVIANDELSTDTGQLDGVTRWYILANVLYDDADIPFDEANQLGIGADIDINEIKTPTKIWSKSSGNVSLNNHTDRVQDIVQLRDSEADDPSSRKYPVDPTADSYTRVIDAVHAALHVYEREGPKGTRDWLAQREMKSNQQFKTAVKALLEGAPEDSQMRETLQDLIAGDTGEYLGISVRELNIGEQAGDRQAGIEEYSE